VLPCAHASTCAVPHGDGHTCGDATCVAVRCHAGYAFVDGSSCVCVGTACRGRRAAHVHATVRPTWAALLVLALAGAVLAGVACPHWHAHHRGLRANDDHVVELVAAPYRPLPASPPPPSLPLPPPRPSAPFARVRVPTLRLRPPAIWAGGGRPYGGR
jgi:hypothetical protein